MANRKEVLQIPAGELNDDGKNLTLSVRLKNSTDRTLHAYASVRALRYDPTSHILEVQLSDRNLREVHLRGNFVLPKFISIDPHGESTVELQLPRTIARMQPGANQVSPTIEELPAHEAQHVQVEIAYSGTPFYKDARKRAAKTPRAMMVDWAEGHALHKFSVRDQQSRRAK